MAEYVRMPKAHYEAACNSIRAKTGKTDLIKSGVMSAEIESITGGGGSSADVRYVTFMSYDGSIEYGKKAVAVGDDCADPIARGVFDTPTRESTAQYNYTFYGWATTPGGGADANWDKTITEDKTVYANFSAAVRYYTITYLDTDETVLKTETLAYGTTLDYTPKKTGFVFLGWKPEVVAVAENATYYAQWKEQSGFNEVAMLSITDMPFSRSTLRYQDFAINSAGNRLALALSDYRNDINNAQPAVYDIAGDEPMLLYSDSGMGYASEVEFAHDGDLIALSYSGSTYYKVEYTVDGSTGYAKIRHETVSPARSGMATSPVADIFGWRYSGKYDIVNGTTTVTVTPPASANFSVFAPSGDQIAILSKSFGIKVYNLTGTLLADTGKFGSTNTTHVSYNADGSLMAVSYSVAPWVAVYETTNYTKLFDLSNVLTATSYAEFIGDDTLVIGSGTKVSVYTVTESGVKDFEHDVPTCEGETIYGVRKNHTGTRVVFCRDKSVVVWAKI